MENKSFEKEQNSKKFRVPIGDTIAYVEIISLRNHICAIELPGRDPIFITRVRGKNNESHWVSIPQGDEELAIAIGAYIDTQVRNEGNHRI